MNTKREIILITRNSDNPNEIEILFGSIPTDNKAFDFYCKSLDCRSIDIVNVQIGIKPYELIVDDEAILEQKLPMATLYKKQQCCGIIAGAFLIARFNTQGKLIPLSVEDFHYIENNLQVVTQENGYQVVKFQC